MNFKNRSALILTIVIAVLLIVGSAGLGFFVGQQHQAWRVELLEKERIIQDDRNATALEQKDKELNRTLNDYDSACFEFQELYAAYEKLYAKAGASSGEPRYSAPDGARGNEESCYR
ncbi:MAG TPA: hypothetical protein VD907_00180 [Verrucomicrobiae bacterium]|nr:hypothetical protein [Verrucomicrobiae bacterium]